MHTIIKPKFMQDINKLRSKRGFICRYQISNVYKISGEVAFNLKPALFFANRFHKNHQVRRHILSPVRMEYPA